MFVMKTTGENKYIMYFIKENLRLALSYIHNQVFLLTVETIKRSINAISN